MAKITKEDIAVAHNLIRAKDLDGLCKWIDLYKVQLDKKVFRETFRKVFLFGDIEKALKMFDAIGLEGSNPELANLLVKSVTYLGCAASMLLLLGCLGGVVYLFSVLFG